MLSMLLALSAAPLLDANDAEAAKSCKTERVRAQQEAAHQEDPNRIVLVHSPDCPRADVIVVVGRAWRTRDEIASTVDVVDAVLLRQQTVSNLADALSLVPGVQVVQTGPLGAQASVFVRGTDSDHVLATSHGIRLNSPATPNGLYSFGSDLVTEGYAVEVLRGPGSATYGSDAIGGVVNLVPSARPGGAVSVSVGELRTVQGSGYAAGRADALTYTVGGAYQRTDGWDALPGRIVPEERAAERDGAEGFSLNADLDYRATDAITLSLTALHREAEAEFDTFSGGPTGFQRADTDDLSSEDRLSVLRGGVSYAPGPWSVTANVGLVDADFRETSGEAVTGDVRGERVFAELLGRYEADALSVSSGVIYEDETADIPVSFNDPLKASEDHGGAFVFAQYDATDTVVLSGALRLDQYAAFGTAFTWNAGASWSAGGLRLRANAGTAFNAPSLAERFSVSAFNLGNPDLSEEEALAGEAAAAYTLDAGLGSLTAEAVLFRTDTDDLIEYDFKQMANVNVGDARAQGAELSLRWTGGTLSAFAAYTYTDAENRDTGRALLRRPEHGFTANAAWDVDDRLTVSARWVRTGARPDVTYSDQGFFEGTDEARGFDEVAATVRYEVADGLSGFVTATNVLSETYEQPAGFGSAPRQVRAGVRYGW